MATPPIEQLPLYMYIAVRRTMTTSVVGRCLALPSRCLALSSLPVCACVCLCIQVGSPYVLRGVHSSLPVCAYVSVCAFKLPCRARSITCVKVDTMICRHTPVLCETMQTSFTDSQEASANLIQ